MTALGVGLIVCGLAVILGSVAIRVFSKRSTVAEDAPDDRQRGD
jgi:hypothetical protein